MSFPAHKLCIPHNYTKDSCSCIIKSVKLTHSLSDCHHRQHNTVHSVLGHGALCTDRHYLKKFLASWHLLQQVVGGVACVTYILLLLTIRRVDVIGSYLTVVIELLVQRFLARSAEPKAKPICTKIECSFFCGPTNTTQPFVCHHRLIVVFTYQHTNLLMSGFQH